MKTSAIVLFCLSLLIPPSFAEESAKARPGRPLREEILKKFDANGDGQLNDAEREAAKKAREERVAKRGPRGDRPAFKRAVEQFDKDGDGKLNEEERKAAKAALKERGAGRKGPAHGPAKGRPGNRSGKGKGKSASI